MSTDIDVRDLHRQALEAFGATVDRVPPTAWRQPTPCAGWDVRDLVNHVVAENRWVTPLLDGATVADVGPTLDGDLVGDDPIAGWHASATEALEAVRGCDIDRVVHLSFGDVPAAEYLWQLTTDALVHAWDLARATGAPESLPGDLVDACSAWFDSAEDAYRSAGAIGPSVAPPDDSAQATLLGRFGRNASDRDPRPWWCGSISHSAPATSTPSAPPSARTAASSTPRHPTASNTGAARRCSRRSRTCSLPRRRPRSPSPTVWSSRRTPT